ncbi:hypothetical protein COLO4_31537 [Corchorus olitorius]|uniref:Uncharacterized protein n=1 Tax=Corchorus olitorius TaxID=93759 RepID=A0A1R3H407_9ROSI|nr:hypothetical protein COLO4_31537 [Corchorus olitorius]
MGQEESYFYSWPPVGAPLNVQREDHWKHFDNSVNAVSFGFVATAILISMFLVMAIFERFLRPNSSHGGRNHGDLESQLTFNGKLGHPSPKAMAHLISEGFAAVECVDLSVAAYGRYLRLETNGQTMVDKFGLIVFLFSALNMNYLILDGTSDLVLKDPYSGFLRHNVPDRILSSTCWGTMELMTIYTSGVSVLMPGDEIPTFIAHPAPVPCLPEHRSLPHNNHQKSPVNPGSNSSININES